MDRYIKGCLAALLAGVLAVPALAADAPKPAGGGAGGVGGSGSPLTVTPKPEAKPEAKPEDKPLAPPPGFERVTVGNFTVLCEPNDVAWVNKALAGVGEAEKIKGGPADMVKEFPKNRESLLKQMKEDLALADDKEAAELFDKEILPSLTKMDTLKVPAVFLVITSERLKEVCKNGWGEPFYHYNGVADAVAYNDNLAISIDQPMKEQILPAFYNRNDPVEARQAGLTNGIKRLQQGVAGRIAEQSLPTVFGQISKWLDEKQFEPLKLSREQSWLRWGLNSYLAAKYTSLVTNVPKDRFLVELLQEHQLAPVSARSVDLLKPLAENSMRKEMAPFYEVALRKKGTAVVALMVNKGGEKAVGDVMQALRTKVPADGPGLLALVKDKAKVDLSGYMPAWAVLQ